ncbi:RagB/SusD family nutrient uptake outer membrane protein [Massilibacteroides vaginae]|uniref:RagB/SusD family nutrient uptake outer membrane protein n=1 Tax=Massilibacteroides vaginae TaxID=1673718 RepID=UPI000A1CAA2C|nr:RagB/SusD family nutrient uptake outer membrane protein [Massilibacteroides vaginae]
MKRNILYSLVILFLITFTHSGCSGFLEENTRGKVFDNVLSTQNGLEAALTGAYRGWANCWTYGFNNGWATEMTLGGDDLTCPPGTGNTQEFDRYDVKNTNSSSPTVFWGCYKAIQGANNIIDNYEACTGSANVITQIAGEAYFIRAYSYYWLVRCHGDIPLMLKAAFDLNDLNIQPSTVKEVYTQIEADLAKAIEMLEDNRRNSEAGRPNKGSALALLAEVYLSEAGWPLKETEKYALAASTAKEVIDNKAKYGFDLESSYAVLYENDETNSGINKEDIFTIPCNRANGNTTNAMYGYWAYPGELGGWDVVFSELTFYKEFPEGVRKDATFATTVKTQDGNVLTWQELKNPRPYYKKLMKNEKAPDYYNFASSVPMRMLRYTQTVLTYAEAKARSGGPDQLAYDCLNSIRTRAELSTYSGLSAEEFANKCIDERVWELCGERVRWFDMVRLEIIQQVLSKRDPSDNQPLHAITEKSYTFPIPQHDELLNVNLNTK